jgi:hypothetical protein
VLGHDLVGVLHDGLVEGDEHLVEVAGLDDAIGEGCVVGFVGVPALEESEGAGVVLVSENIEGLAALGGSHAVATLGEQLGEDVLLAGGGVEVGDGRDAHQNGTSVARSPVPCWREATRSPLLTLRATIVACSDSHPRPNILPAFASRSQPECNAHAGRKSREGVTGPPTSLVNDTLPKAKMPPPAPPPLVLLAVTTEFLNDTLSLAKTPPPMTATVLPVAVELINDTLPGVAIPPPRRRRSCRR